MRIVIALSYYVPYVSGLTNVARDVAEGLAARGHDVTVVTNGHDAALPREERIGGVRVVRCPVRVRFGKGVVAPSFVGTVARWAKGADVVNVHAPMLEAGAVLARLRGSVPTVVTYHCDIDMPEGLVNRLQQTVMDASNAAAARRADRVVVTSDDYADASRIAASLADGRVVIPPGCHDRGTGSPSFRDGDGPHVGFLGRIVEEKGIEYLVQGFTAIEDPTARLIVAGDFAGIAGGSVIERVRAAIGADPRIRVLGFVPDERIPDFYASLDVFALTSVNSFEAFGIVQVEAMLAGVPVVASDLPGVRTPVQTSGLGRIVPKRDAAAITVAIPEVAAIDVSPEAIEDVRARYGVASAVDRYERAFQELAAG